MKVVVARSAQGDVTATGVAVCYCEIPMVGIKQADGSVAWWRADMTELAALAELHALAVASVMK
jgi:hypothetical protein